MMMMMMFDGGDDDGDIPINDDIAVTLLKG